MSDGHHGPGVPLIGEPVTVIGWICIVHVRHNCAQPAQVNVVVKHTPFGLSADLALCPSCAQTFHVSGVQMTPHGQLAFGFAVGERPLAGAPS